MKRNKYVSSICRCLLGAKVMTSCHIEPKGYRIARDCVLPARSTLAPLMTKPSQPQRPSLDILYQHLGISFNVRDLELIQGSPFRWAVYPGHDLPTFDIPILNQSKNINSYTVVYYGELPLMITVNAPLPFCYIPIYKMTAGPRLVDESAQALIKIYYQDYLREYGVGETHLELLLKQDRFLSDGPTYTIAGLPFNHAPQFENAFPFDIDAAFFEYLHTIPAEADTLVYQSGLGREALLLADTRRQDPKTRQAGRLTAVDSSYLGIRNTLLNLALNGIPLNSIDTTYEDALNDDDLFDYIVYRSPPLNIEESQPRAVSQFYALSRYSDDFVFQKRHFLMNASYHLKPGGKVLMVMHETDLLFNLKTYAEDLGYSARTITTADGPGITSALVELTWNGRQETVTFPVWRPEGVEMPTFPLTPFHLMSIPELAELLVKLPNLETYRHMPSGSFSRITGARFDDEAPDPGYRVIVELFARFEEMLITGGVDADSSFAGFAEQIWEDDPVDPSFTLGRRLLLGALFLAESARSSLRRLEDFSISDNLSVTEQRAAYLDRVRVLEEAIAGHSLFADADPSTQEGIERILEKAFTLFNSNTNGQAYPGLFLKEDRVLPLLAQNLPVNLMGHHNVSTLAELIDIFGGVLPLFSVLRFTEDSFWLERMYSLYETLTPEDFEQRPIQTLVIDKDMLTPQAAEVLEKKLPFSDDKVTGTVFGVVCPKEAFGEVPILRSLTRALHYLFEVRFYSKYTSLIAHHPDTFGAAFSSILMGPNPQVMDSNFFEPHTLAEGMFYREAIDALHQLKTDIPELDLWDSSSGFGWILYDKDGTMEFISLMDLITELSKGRPSHLHLKRHIKSRLFDIYTGREPSRKSLLHVLAEARFADDSRSKTGELIKLSNTYLMFLAPLFCTGGQEVREVVIESVGRPLYDIDAARTLIKKALRAFEKEMRASLDEPHTPLAYMAANFLGLFPAQVDARFGVSEWLYESLSLSLTGKLESELAMQNGITLYPIAYDQAVSSSA